MLSGECDFIKTEFSLIAEATYAEPAAFSTLIFQKRKKIQHVMLVTLGVQHRGATCCLWHFKHHVDYTCSEQTIDDMMLTMPEVHQH